MIYSIRGTFLVKSATQVVIEAAGVGYDVQISLTTYADLDGLTEGKLFTYQYVREDALMLFGFSTLREKSLFELLLSVSGVGANTARMILSSLRPEEIEQAILGDHIPVLQGVKGIGAKTAQRIVLDLKDKVAKFAVAQELDAVPAVQLHAEEARAALVTLGIPAKQAEAVLKKLMKENAVQSTEDLVRAALQMI